MTAFMISSTQIGRTASGSSVNSKNRPPAMKYVKLNRPPAMKYVKLNRLEACTMK
jgi:hypothetical protein